MKKFKFSLEPLLNVKKGLEKTQKAQIQKIQQEIDIKENEAEVISSEISALQQSLESELKGKVSVEDLIQYDRYMQKLTDNLEIKREEISKLTQEKEECQKALIETTKEIKMLEKLREKQYSQYIYELEREQEKEISDFVSFVTSSS